MSKLLKKRMQSKIYLGVYHILSINRSFNSVYKSYDRKRKIKKWTDPKGKVMLKYNPEIWKERI